MNGTTNDHTRMRPDKIDNLEEMMVQSEKMLSVGGLAAGMAHEINNPLAGMMQNAQVLINRLTKPIPVNETAALRAGTSMASIKTFMARLWDYYIIEILDINIVNVESCPL